MKWLTSRRRGTTGVAELRVPVGVPLVVEKISPAPFWKDSYIDAYMNHKPRDLKEMSLGMLDPKTIVCGRWTEKSSPSPHRADTSMTWFR